MTQQIQFREFEVTDFDDSLLIAREAWPDDTAMLPETFLRSDIGLYFSLATWARVATVSGRVVGVLLGQIHNDLSLLGQIRSIILSMWQVLLISLGAYDQLPRRFTFVRKYLATEIRWARNRPASDAEVTLLMVAAGYRGLGIGKQLMDLFLGTARDKGAQKASVSTEEDSNWRFYEHYGFSRCCDFYDDLDSFIRNRDIRAFYYTFDL